MELHGRITEYEWNGFMFKNVATGQLGPHPGYFSCCKKRLDNHLYIEITLYHVYVVQCFRVDPLSVPFL